MLPVPKMSTRGAIRCYSSQSLFRANIEKVMKLIRLRDSDFTGYTRFQTLDFDPFVISSESGGGGCISCEALAGVPGVSIVG